MEKFSLLVDNDEVKNLQENIKANIGYAKYFYEINDIDGLRASLMVASQCAERWNEIECEAICDKYYDKEGRICL